MTHFSVFVLFLVCAKDVERQPWRCDSISARIRSRSCRNVQPVRRIEILPLAACKKRIRFSVATAEWKFATNATDFNRRRMKEQQNLASKFECLSWRRAARFDTSRILDPNIRRQLGRILEQGKCGLGDDKYLEVSSMRISSHDEHFQPIHVTHNNLP